MQLSINLLVLSFLLLLFVFQVFQRLRAWNNPPAPHPLHLFFLACLFRFCLDFPSGLLGRRFGSFGQWTPCPNTPLAPCDL